MRESGLAIDLRPDVQWACRSALKRLLGNETYERYERWGWLDYPMLRYLSGPHMACKVGDKIVTDDPKQANSREAELDLDLRRRKLIAAPVALPAWRIPNGLFSYRATNEGRRGSSTGESLAPEFDGHFSHTMKAALEAYAWTRANAHTLHLRPSWFAALCLATSQWPPSTFIYR